MKPRSVPWAEQLSPRLLKSPWWIGHIPFAYEVIDPRPTPSWNLAPGGSSFAAFCQAVEAFGLDAKCYGVDLWRSDIHRRFEDLSGNIRLRGSTYPPPFAGARDFSEAAGCFRTSRSIFCTSTVHMLSVSNDFHLASGCQTAPSCCSTTSMLRSRIQVTPPFGLGSEVLRQQKGIPLASVHPLLGTRRIDRGRSTAGRHGAGRDGTHRVLGLFRRRRAGIPALREHGCGPARTGPVRPARPCTGRSTRCIGSCGACVES